MTDLDTALAGTTPEPVTSESTATPRRCKRHEWWVRQRASGDEFYCRRCDAIKDEARSRRGRTARNRGNQFERDVAKRLGVKRVGQYGEKDDVRGDWIRVQCKVGQSYPERIDGWLRSLPADAGQLRAVVIGDSPGSGGRRRTLIVLDFEDFVAWYGKEETP